MNMDKTFNDEQQNDLNGNGNAFGGGAPLSFGSNADDEQYRASGGYKASGGHGPTQLGFSPFSGMDNPAPMMAKGQHQTAVHVETMAFGSSAPLSFDAPMQPMMGGMKEMANKQPLIQVLPNSESNEVMDFSEFKQEPAFFVPSKCAPPSGLEATPVFYNEMTSMVVDESPDTVLRQLATLLSGYTNDIDFSVDDANYQIVGQVFVRNLAVFFKITVWDEGSNKTRFECRRTKGDTVAFTEFWNNMEEALHREFGSATGFDHGDEDDEVQDLQFGALLPLDYNLTLDLGDLDEDGDGDVDADGDGDGASGLTPKDLGDFVYEMQHSDPSVVYSIAMLIDAVQVSTASMLLNHAQFLQCVIGTALGHQDTALVRGALVMLEKLCDDNQSGADTLIGYKVLERVIPLLNHEVDLIRKYAVRLLGKLCAAKSWPLKNAKLLKFAEFSVKECRDKWRNAHFATNDFIENQMFEDIHNKLVSVQ